jgi:hypothetical protein
LANVAAPSIAPFLDGTEQAGLEITLGQLDHALPGIDFQQGPEASARLCYADQAVIIDVTQHAPEPLRIHHRGQHFTCHSSLSREQLPNDAGNRRQF